MVKDIIVGAHYGLKDWLAQRITAAVMAAYSLFLAVLLLGQERLTFETWRAFMAGVISSASCSVSANPNNSGRFVTGVTLMMMGRKTSMCIC